MRSTLRIVAGLVAPAIIALLSVLPLSAQRPIGDAWIEISEPAEWRGETTRGFAVQTGEAIRVVGTAYHPNGIQRVLINGLRATVAPEPSGAVRFVGYVNAGETAGEVELAVYPRGDRPMVRGFGLRPRPSSSGATANPWDARHTDRERWAVIIGVSDYQDPLVPPLQYADDDARAMRDFLGYPPLRVRVFGFRLARTP